MADILIEQAGPIILIYRRGFLPRLTTIVLGGGMICRFFFNCTDIQTDPAAFLAIDLRVISFTFIENGFLIRLKGV